MTRINRDIRDVNGWGGFGEYWEERLRKLDDQWLKQVPKDAGNLFQGLRFWVNGLTDPPQSQLKQIFLKNGGILDLVKTPKTDFELVETLPRGKMLRLLHHHQIVKPKFITDCLKAGKLVDWKKYRLWKDQSGNLFTTKEEKMNARFIGKLSSPNFIDEKIYERSGYSEEQRMALSEELQDFLKERKLPKSWEDYTHPRKSIGEYYKKSRLHWLSTWKAELHHLVAELTRPPLMEGEKIGQFIAHIDIDSFFVSVAILDQPELRGRPIAICHGTTASYGNKNPSKKQKAAEDVENNDLLETHRIGHGGHKVEAGESFSEIASCSYEARALGIKADMYLGQALKICPELVVLDYQLEDCKKVSEILYATCANFTPFIEAVSCDELYMDLTKLVYKSNKATKEIAAEVKQKFKDKTGINVSIGLGPSRMLARMATKKAKPNGIYEISDGFEITELMENTPFIDVPQMGGQTLKKIGEILIKNDIPFRDPIMCSDVAKIPRDLLAAANFGPNHIKQILSSCRGELKEQLEYEKYPKTIGSDINYGIRFRNWIMAEEFLTALTHYIIGKMNKYKVEGTKLTVKLNYRAKEADFEPIKYGGMGYCESQTSTKDVISLNVPTVVEVAKSMLSSFCVPLYDWRGIRMSFTVEKVEKNVLKRKTAEGMVTNLDDFLPQSWHRTHHASMDHLESRMRRFRNMDSFEKREAIKFQLKKSIQECFVLDIYLDFVKDFIGLLLDIERRDLAEFCLIQAKIPALAARMLKPRDWENFSKTQLARIHFQ